MGQQKRATIAARGYAPRRQPGGDGVARARGTGRRGVRLPLEDINGSSRSAQRRALCRTRLQSSSLHAKRTLHDGSPQSLHHRREKNCQVFRKTL